MGARKAQLVAEAPGPLVRLAEVLAELAGDGNPGAWRAQAEQMAETMRGQVTRDWAGCPCLSWLDAERLYQRLLRDRAQRTAEIEERAIAADEARRANLPTGIPAGQIPEGITPAMLLMLSDSERQGSRRRSVVEDALAHAGTVFTPIGGEP